MGVNGRKRILLISSNSSGRGGGERYLVYLTIGLRSIGYDADVLISNLEYMDPWYGELTAAGAEVHRSRLIGLRHRPLRFIQSIMDKAQQSEIANICRQVSPDGIVINQQYDEDGLDYVAGAIQAGVAPVGGTMHMPMTAEKHKRPLGRSRGRVLQSWYKKHPYKLMLVSKGGQAEFENYYDYPRPTSVVHYGCPFPDRDMHSLDLPVVWQTSNLPVIGFSGQFVPQKNLSLLVESWLWARSKGTESRLLLIGDGPERKSVEARLNEAAPRDCWHITGWQTTPEAYLSAIDIYCMTSRFEGLPLALLEAAGSGLPAVVVNFNGALDVAEKAPWVKVVSSDRPEIIGQALIDQSTNLAEFQRLAMQGQSDFRQYFSPERMARDTIQALGL